MVKHTRIEAQVLEGGVYAKEAVVCVYYPPRKGGFKEFTVNDQPKIKDMIKVRMGDEFWRVYLYIVSSLDYENKLYLNQTICAEHLGLQRTNVNRAVRKIIDIGILSKTDRKLNYFFTPELAWKGSAANHIKAITCN